jgi:hypothetical protein
MNGFRVRHVEVNGDNPLASPGAEGFTRRQITDTGKYGHALLRTTNRAGRANAGGRASDQDESRSTLDSYLKCIFFQFSRIVTESLQSRAVFERDFFTTPSGFIYNGVTRSTFLGSYN